MLHNEGANRDMEVILMVFLKKKIIWGNLVILAQKWCVLITLNLLQVFFLILHNERAQEVLLVIFREKILFGAIKSF